MATRKINGFEYPLPGVDTAIKTLRPGARYDLKDKEFIDWIDDEGREPPTFEELEEEIRREFYIFNDYEYERNREKEFPSVIDQLDLLYHDIKNNNLSDGSWIKTIESVKNKYPKPE